MAKPKVSIIIPFREPDSQLAECMMHIKKMGFGNFEAILLPDNPMKGAEGERVFATGPVKPAVKRNIGIRKARGEIIACIDSDAYPARDWVSNALPFFRDKKVAVVGGPNITKPSDSELEKASGDVFGSIAGAGAFSQRVGGRGNHDVEELPSCNLFLRKRDVEEAGAWFDETILTGEDSKTCFDLKKAGKKIVFSPNVVVYHHRRSLFVPHLKQVWNYGRDKAFLLREHFTPKRAYYAIPSAIVLYTAMGAVASVYSWHARVFFLGTVVLYAVGVFVSGLLKNPSRIHLVFPAIILTHFTYGIAFITGMLRQKP